MNTNLKRLYLALNELDFDLGSIQDQISHAKELIEEAQEQEDLILPHESFNDQLKIELLKKHWDNITIKQIEQIVPETFAYSSHNTK